MASTIHLEDVQVWSDTLSERERVTLEKHAEEVENQEDGPTEPRFPYREGINQRVRLHYGPAHELATEAVAHASNERIDFLEKESQELLERAGEGLFVACSEIGGCKTSEAKVTSAFNLPARAVIHAVGPAYSSNPDMARAAETALARAYRTTLEQMLMHSLRTLALPCLYTESKGYPRPQGSHVALRTVRRFLEHWESRLDAIVFCVEGSDRELYERNMRLYFPRSEAEERVARAILPPHPCDEFGEAYEEGRDLEIKALPLGSRRASVTSLEPLWWGQFERVGMQAGPADPDAEAELSHVRLLKRARQFDLSDVYHRHILYKAGEDAAGRPVIAMIGAHLQAALADGLEERVLMHAAREVGPMCRQRFTGLYVHSGCTKPPTVAFARVLQTALGPRHKDNLKVLYILHPNNRLKAEVYLLSVLPCGPSGRVLSKVAFLDSIWSLQQCGCRDVSLPEVAFDQDGSSCRDLSEVQQPA